MKKNFFVSSLLCALLGFGAVQLAHGQASAPSGSTAGRAASAPLPPIAGRAVLGVTVAETELVATGYRASKLINLDVNNDKNEKIGKIDDLIISTDGTLTIAVLSVGGFLGLGRHLVAIPVRQFAHIAPKAVLPNASKDELKKLPKFEYVSK
jgi:hypothetical protein